jgi:hypothetical protein
MDVKEAVAYAKQYVNELFGSESATNIGLEEVEFNDSGNEWRVTIGFSRPWDEPRNVFTAIAGAASPARSYKTVHIDNASGTVRSVTSHEARN